VIFPAVTRLNRRLPLWASLLIVYAVVIAVVAISLSFVVPAVSNNVKQFAHDAPGLVRQAQAYLADPNNPIVSRLPPEAKTYLEKLPQEIDALVSRYGAEAAGTVFSVLASVIGILAIFIVVPVVALYILIDKDAMYRDFVSVIPPEKRDKTLKILREINAVVGGFIRGQLLVAIIVGILITLMLSLLHVRYAVLIGVIAGLLEIIPYLGAFVGATPAVLIALVTNGPINALLVVAGFVAINQIEGHVISPLVVGESVGLPPLAIIVALLAGGELFGLPGLLLAVPVAGIIKVLLANFVPRYAPVDV
jgi:predicted PurR-regulated permease PerM